MAERDLQLVLIGMGAGNPEHMTLEAITALQSADLILIPEKGEEKSELAEVRRAICARHLGAEAPLAPFQQPVRDPAIADYQTRVDSWHDAIADCWRDVIDTNPEARTVGLLVWGDPALYDSTLRIAERLRQSCRLQLRLVPGITAIQSLTSAMQIPLNDIDGAVHITTGRRLRAEGWPAGTETVVVMLDGECSFQHLPPPGLEICWGAYLGLPQEVTRRGPLSEMAEDIIRTRAAAREKHGWIMDTYLIRKQSTDI